MFRVIESLIYIIMEKFEYTSIYYNGKNLKLFDELNKLGSEGWELVNVIHKRYLFIRGYFIYTFKRKLSE